MKRTSKVEKTRVEEAKYQKEASSLDLTLFFAFFSVFFVKSHNSKVNLMKIKEGTHKDHKASCLLLWKKIFSKNE